MNITVTCRHDYPTDDVKNYAREKAHKLSRFSKQVQRVEVVLDYKNEHHSAETRLSLVRGAPLIGRAVHEDVLAAIDLVIDKMERQIVRFKEKTKNHRAGRRPAEEGPARFDSDLAGDED